MSIREYFGFGGQIDAVQRIHRRIAVHLLWMALAIVAAALQLGGRVKALESGVLCGVPFALLIVSAIQLFRLRRTLRDPERLRQYGILFGDERIRTIGSRAGGICFWSITYLEFIAFLVAGFMELPIALPLAWIVYGSCLLYVVVYHLLNRLM